MNSLKELTDLELIKLKWEAEERREQWLIDRIKNEMSRRNSEL